MNARRESLFTRPKRSCFQSLPVIRSHGVCSAQCEGSRPFRLKAFAAVQAALPVLDGIVDSTNIGAIFRSAAALGMDAVLLSPTCCDPLCRRAIRVSMGTVFQIPWAKLQPDEEGNRFGRLKALGFRLAATALKNDSVSIDDPRLAAEPPPCRCNGHGRNGA